MLKRKILIFSIFLICVVVLITSPAAIATSLENIADTVKNILKEDKNITNNEFIVDTDISLAPEGDANGNKKIDAGDIVRFTYTIKNGTEKNYAFGTLQTHIDRTRFNFFHNLIGTNNLVDDDKTISITNLRINPAETLVISFDARTLYDTNDQSISTEGEFMDSDKNSVAKSKKLEKKVENNMPDFIPGVKHEKKEN